MPGVGSSKILMAIKLVVNSIASRCGVKGSDAASACCRLYEVAADESLQQRCPSDAGLTQSEADIVDLKLVQP